MHEELLRKKGISKYRLAELSGVSYSVLQDLFSGKASILNCTYYTVSALAAALELEVENFVREFADETFTEYEEEEPIQAWVYRVGKSKLVIMTDCDRYKQMKMDMILNERTIVYAKELARMRLLAEIREHQQEKTQRELDELFRRRTENE